MAEPFIGEIRVFPYNFAPKGWIQCAGQLLPISQNQALFSLLGTTYGGNGTTNFAVPDLRGRVAISSGQGPGLPNYNLGQVAGEESHTLISSEMAAHTHGMAAQSGTATTNAPANYFASPTGTSQTNLYATTANATADDAIVNPVGNGGAHENRQPLLAMTVCIATVGIYPSRN